MVLTNLSDMLIIKKEDFPPKILNENDICVNVIYLDSSEDMSIHYIYTENYGYAFKENKDNKNFEEIREKRELSADEKEIVEDRIEQKKRNDEYKRIFIASLPAIQAFEKSMQCGNRSEGQGIGI